MTKTSHELDQDSPLELRSPSLRDPTSQAFEFYLKFPAITADIELNPEVNAARWKGQSILLTPQEYEILESILIAWPGFATVDSLYNDIWRDHEIANPESVIKSHISKIRSKFRVVDPTFAQITTINGEGYYWGQRPASIITRGSLELFCPLHIAHWDGHQLLLSRWEMNLLSILAKRKLAQVQKFIFGANQATLATKLSQLNKKFKPYTHGLRLVVRSRQYMDALQFNSKLIPY